MNTRTRGARAQELDAMLLRLAAQGVRPRCGEPAAHAVFLSDVAEERAVAATWCAGCPVLDECGAASGTAAASSRPSRTHLQLKETQ